MALPFLGNILTIYQIPTVILHHGAQQFRSLVASFDILLATFAANAVVLGSLLQDRGYKKEKYKYKYGAGAGTEFNVKRDQIATMRGARGREVWDSDEELVTPADGDKEGDLVIGMRELDMAGKVERDSSESSRKGKPEVPPKAKFPEIRIASTWEVKVVDLKTGKGRE